MNARIFESGFNCQRSTVDNQKRLVHHKDENDKINGKGFVFHLKLIVASRNRDNNAIDKMKISLLFVRLVW